ncbi:uncharacterized protein [Euphorbia lathyris]|uniref:uncharacterized protein isoform X2 n=1 Tax=Euphorbia lathyris TaxID=212925 RepID=UPI003313C15A
MNSTFEQVIDGNNIMLNDLQNNNDVLDMGDPDFACSFCGALMWYQERIHKDRNSATPLFSLCCGAGKVKIPFLKDPPATLKNLLFRVDSRSNNFLENIRSYNMMFSFTSMGGKIDTSVNNGNGPYVFRLHGQNCHMIGSLMPESGSNLKFAQLYIYDSENEVSNRAGAIRC